VTPRRVVTGHDARGVAKVLIDDRATNARSRDGSVVSTLVWCTDATPAPIGLGEEIEDMGARMLGTPPPENGTRFCVIEFAPGSESELHRTETLDYAIVLDGEIEMPLDEEVVQLRAGDIVVQRGTNHAWRNRGNVPARVAFVLIDALPLGIGHPRVRAS
jgi:quercetin dioxygenase-like cupin family protein